MYEFGLFLRRRYGGFISSKYSAAETYVISSIRNRCLMSAELVLAGLYPPDGIQIWNQDLPWQPIPVHSIPTPCDDVRESPSYQRTRKLLHQSKGPNGPLDKIYDQLPLQNFTLNMIRAMKVSEINS